MSKQSEILLTPAALLDFLLQVEELKDYNIVMSEGVDENGFTVSIGDSQYQIRAEDACEVEVEPEDISAMGEAIEETYAELENNENVDLNYENQTKVESGIIKETLKTLMIGGMVRLTAKWLKGN